MPSSSLPPSLSGNNRGNRYSHKHLRLSPSEDAYWNFSIDELARYDVPALIEYVLAATKQEKLCYVGYVFFLRPWICIFICFRVID